MKNIFTVNDIITIVMEEVNSLKEKQIYSIENDEYNLPKPILDKLSSLNKYEFDEFTKRVSIIAEEILEMQSGELNELNIFHAEITFVIEDILGKEWIN
ncbi:hypothetical protein CQ395_15155 [Clostridium neonatale]|uniref:Uncharacterized protein n=1 Tax=Clostridium neonatale TaxID=137838 RepID=A0A2A7MFZ2_9CLOT|nr:hypothetical protein [Clostridium neonatale]PEG25893.1 hypothetical protein CQ395_15155 [Clostridium neonatale]PEG30654.1 hypothetical protein CQ394_02720 [Clostridium neonatale]CAH0436594.1 Conserved hypothetical protein [Clostridium neonatale]CAI3244317.1 Conserved hypothetical protein [Clostridium neonatale]CAI3249644.1 Conserved hypothetical protein [Clostridium neonatale]